MNEVFLVYHMLIFAISNTKSISQFKYQHFCSYLLWIFIKVNLDIQMQNRKPQIEIKF